jgi:hypothetical protein
MRSKIRLVLCDNDGALQDALEALNGLSFHDAVYPRALVKDPFLLLAV